MVWRFSSARLQSFAALDLAASLSRSAANASWAQWTCVERMLCTFWFMLCTLISPHRQQAQSMAYLLSCMAVHTAGAKSGCLFDPAWMAVDGAK